MSRMQSYRRRSLTIGLVNNAGERAKKTTERQFRALLDAASPDVTVDFRTMGFPQIIEPGPDRSRSGWDLNEIFGVDLDGVIVTGMEPTVANLQDEPVWRNLTRIVDWAERRSVPVLWSCLAAHAAVLYIDGIARRRLPSKLSGVYECELVMDQHVFCAGLPGRWRAPHSRLNEVSEETLVAAGYDILSRIDGHGVDLFAKTCGSVFLFAQGHPEYDGQSLLAEYRRDVRRYFSRERRDFPATCVNCFDGVTEGALDELRREALARRGDAAILAEITRVLDGVECAHAWRAESRALYRNWLFAIASGELERVCDRSLSRDRLPARAGGVAGLDPVLVS